MRLLLAGLEQKMASALLREAAELKPIGRVLPTLKHLAAAVSREHPDVLAVYVGKQPEQVFQQLEALHNSHPRLQIVALARYPDPRLTQLADAAGCVDVAVLHRGPHDFVRALKHLAERGLGGGTLIAMFGGKGGMGTTTLAVNLAAAIAAREHSTVVVDLNLYLGDVALSLGLDPKPSLHWYLRAPEKRLEKSVVERSVPRHPSKLRVLGLDPDIGSAEALNADQVMQLVDALRNVFHFVVLDCGSSMNEETLAAAAAADHRIIVTGEDRPAVDGAGRRIKALESLGVSMKTTALVVNRAHAKAGVNWSNVEKKYGVRVLGKVRNDWKTVAGALERAALLSQDAPDAAVNRDIDGLADALGVARPEGDDTRGGGLGRSLMSMFGG